MLPLICVVQTNLLISTSFDALLSHWFDLFHLYSLAGSQRRLRSLLCWPIFNHLFLENIEAVFTLLGFIGVRLLKTRIFWVKIIYWCLILLFLVHLTSNHLICGNKVDIADDRSHVAPWKWLDLTWRLCGDILLTRQIVLMLLYGLNLFNFFSLKGLFLNSPFIWILIVGSIPKPTLMIFYILTVFKTA